MNVLILGASGYLGSKVFYKMKSEANFSLMGTSFQSHNTSGLRKLDVTREEEVKSIIIEFNPDIILWSLMSKESEKLLINEGLNNLFKYLNGNQKLIFISTNAVFRGNGGKGNYSENQEPKYNYSKEPLDLYANAKIDGEKRIGKYENSIIIRPGAIYGQDINGKWDKRISELITNLEYEKEVIRTKNLYNTFVKVDELSSAIIELIKLDYKGIIHLGPVKKESYYDYYRKMASKLNLNEDLIRGNVISEEVDFSINTSKGLEVLGEIFSNV